MTPKILVYLGPLDSIGGTSSDTSAVGILSKFDFVVLANLTLSKTQEVLRALKLAKPAIKVFGYTDLGGAADLATWETSVDSWITGTINSTDKLLDGIFIDNFGFTDGISTATRDNQNSAVTYVHAQGNISAMVNSKSNTLNVFNKYATMADPLIGTTTTITDYVMLDGLYFSRPATTTPVLESKESMYGRLDYVKGAKAAGKTIGYVGLANMGTNTSVPVNDYKNMLDLATEFQMDAVGFAPTDYGTTSYNYFLGKKINDFNS